jgi:leader peptidase (prepilin peptidase)/N-methyltransferase
MELFVQMAPLSLIIFIFGICIGSFLNVCIYRIPAGKSIITPASACPSCRTTLAFYCNIPIFSYLFLKGRCNYCGAAISARYPIVEGITGLVAVSVFFKFGLGMQALFWFTFICTLIVISFIDIDHQIIPDVISLPGIAVFATSFIFIPQMTVKHALFGVLLGGGSLTLVALVYYLLRRQEGMGGGDIKLLAMIGAAIGPKGVLFTIFMGSLAGSIVGFAIILMTRHSGMKLKIPFGPYLSIGAVLYVFYGETITSWYFNLITG